MEETSETGNKQMQELIDNMHDTVFNDWEQQFIRDLHGRKYEHLSKSQKACVTRLIDWLEGK